MKVYVPPTIGPEAVSFVVVDASFMCPYCGHYQPIKSYEKMNGGIMYTIENSEMTHEVDCVQWGVRR